MAYPVSFSVTPPVRPSKLQARLAITFLVIVLAFGYIADFNGWLSVVFFGTIFAMPVLLAVPVLAAMLISQKGGEQYLAEAEQGPISWLRYVMGFFSWMSFASGKFPAQQDVVDLQVQPSGTPTAGSALLRIILVIPLAIALLCSGIIFMYCWTVAAVSILVKGTNPEWAAKAIRGYLRATARVLAYAASLVDEYPPFLDPALYTNAEGES